jgi:outer membrane protein assembly factor BamE (lipoprotein component of BamABCDE complex)
MKKSRLTLTVMAALLLLAACDFSSNRMVDNNCSCSGNGMIKNPAYCTGVLHPNAGPYTGKS